MDINREHITYSDHQAEQLAFDRMAAAARRLAELLMQQPEGVCAEVIGQHWFVARIQGKPELELFMSPDSITAFDRPSGCDVMTLYEINGQSAQDINYVTKELLEFLQSPKFIPCNQMTLNALVSVTHDYLAIKRISP